MSQGPPEDNLASASGTSVTSVAEMFTDDHWLCQVHGVITGAVLIINSVTICPECLRAALQQLGATVRQI